MTGQVGASDLNRLGKWTLLACAIASLTSCATISRHQFAEPTGDWQIRTGQLLYRAPKTTLIGDVFVRFSKNGELELTFSKGPGVTLLFLREDAELRRSQRPVRARGLVWSNRTSAAAIAWLARFARQTHSRARSDDWCDTSPVRKLFYFDSNNASW